MRLLIAAMVVALIALAVALPAAQYKYNIVWTSCETVCQEDMDCWDCKTMGNLQCGPQ